MQPNEPNATKLRVIWESTRFLQPSLIVSGGERFISKTHVLFLNREEGKFRQMRRLTPLNMQKFTINLNEIKMENYFKPNEGKIHGKIMN